MSITHDIPRAASIHTLKPRLWPAPQALKLLKAKRRLSLNGPYGPILFDTVNPGSNLIVARYIGRSMDHIHLNRFRRPCLRPVNLRITIGDHLFCRQNLTCESSGRLFSHYEQVVGVAWIVFMPEHIEPTGFDFAQ
jgi:hypothetical protein